MAFEKVSTILKMAEKANTSVIAFNCTDYNNIYSVIKVADELNKPAICMLYPEHCTKNNITELQTFADTVKALAKNSRAPIGLHLDHHSDFNYIINAIRLGFTSVMYDGSMLPVEENIKNTIEVVKTARIFGADVEAELGQIGFAANATEKDLDLYSKPDVVARFCEQTKVTSIAIAIGSAHGVYSVVPKLDLVRLDEINAATDTPLVLHGGSGIPEDQLEEAFKRGINKFNVGTEYFQLYYDSITEYCNNMGKTGNVFSLPDFVQEKLMAYLRIKMQLTKM